MAIKMILAVLIIISAILIGYFFIGFPKPSNDIVWGVNFSQERAQDFGFGWKKVYTAVLDDLGARNIKIAVNWDFVEGNKGEYYFDDLDFQIEEAENRGAKLIMVIGMKTPGWPECHIPNWAKDLSKEEQQERILAYLEKIVSRYKDSTAIEYWQVENEPFFPFGECAWRDADFLKKEIDLVKSIDHSRKVMVSDSGEFSLWTKAASYGDILGITMYKKAWFKEINRHINYPFPPTFYSRKADLVKTLFKKDVMCVELQAEPWGPELNNKMSVDEQDKIMTLQDMQRNIAFARETNIKRFYLWGAEWWYWMKEKNQRPGFWEEAKKLFQ
jgi:hypothetical protein